MIDQNDFQKKFFVSTAQTNLSYLLRWVAWTGNNDSWSSFGISFSADKAIAWPLLGLLSPSPRFLYMISFVIIKSALL